MISSEPTTTPQSVQSAANGTAERRSAAHPDTHLQARKSKAPVGRLLLILLAIACVLGGLFALGFLPRLAREKELQNIAHTKETTLPLVNVAEVRMAPRQANLILPGNITPIAEAVLNARSDGYLKRRYVDFGERVQEGQLLAEIEAPELDQQVQQAIAAVSQAEAALTRAQHLLAQNVANLQLSEVTAGRWKTLSERGVVSKQEYDQRNSDFVAKQAAVQSSEADVRAAQDSIHAAEANLARLRNMQGYEKVVAPFTGMVTARNVDVGALISSNGQTPLFRLAQLGVLRIMVDVPEMDAPLIKIGDHAEVSLQEFPGRKFFGTVSRTTNSLTANTRTLPTEVQVPNGDGTLMPNMFAQVHFLQSRAGTSILVPGDALIVKSSGTQVALVDADHRVHFQLVEVGRDFGKEIEVLSGLTGGETVILHASDEVREGVKVEPVAQKSAPATPANGNGASAPEHKSK